MNTEIAVSVDIETDGPIIGIHSLRSIGAVAYTHDMFEISRFEVNLEAHGIADTDTMEFWEKWPEAWEHLLKDAVAPHDAMAAFLEWLVAFNHPLRFVAWPCWFDYSWIRQYLLDSTGNDPFERRYVELGQAYLFSGIKPLQVKNETPHQALADAVQQGEQYQFLMMELDRRGKRPWMRGD